MKPTNFNRICSSMCVLMALTLMSACATNPVTGKRDFVTMSEEQELAVGRKNHEQVMKQYQVYDNPELQAYVSRLGQELAQQSHRSNLPFTFTLLDSPEVNAFALPGGYVYITRGIMAYMNSESELAGVLGHEIGHVTARHGVTRQSRGLATQGASILAAVLTGSKEVAQLANAVGSQYVLGYGRDQELEADRLGAEYLARVGYSAEEMLGVVGILKDQEEFEKVKARAEGREPRRYHATQSTHPKNDSRLQEVIRAAKRIDNEATRDPNRDEFLRLMDGVTFGESEQQGIVRGNRFYHGPLDFTVTFPPNWKIANQPTKLVGISADRQAIVQMTLEDLQSGEQPRQFLQRKVENVSQLETLRQSVFPAATGVTNVQTSNGVQPARVAAVSHGGKAYMFGGTFNGGLISNTFFDTVESFRKLKRSEKELARERKFDIVRARSGDTFARLAQSSGLQTFAEEQLRLVNGMFPDGEPQPGQLIKIIR